MAGGLGKSRSAADLVRKQLVLSVIWTTMSRTLDRMVD
jgi:hypothetical protein